MRETVKAIIIALDNHSQSWFLALHKRLELFMFGLHAETMDWLQRQLSQLENWKQDLLDQGHAEIRQLEQIDLHQKWLERQLSALSQSG
jgi:DNA polymerase III delta prime subunit